MVSPTRRVRTDSGSVRQKVIDNLGRLDQLEPKDLEPLINGLNRAIGRTGGDAFTQEYENPVCQHGI